MNRLIRLFTTVKLARLAAIFFFIGYVQADEMRERKFKVDDSTFKCILKMTAVRGFFVDNLAGNLATTVAVAQAGKGRVSRGNFAAADPQRGHDQAAEGVQSGDQ